jgi:hypothetical protein
MIEKASVPSKLISMSCGVADCSAGTIELLKQDAVDTLFPDLSTVAISECELTFSGAKQWFRHVCLFVSMHFFKHCQIQQFEEALLVACSLRPRKSTGTFCHNRDMLCVISLFPHQLQGKVETHQWHCQQVVTMRPLKVRRHKCLNNANADASVKGCHRASFGHQLLELVPGSHEGVG